jgi:hypothetical protein
MVADPAVGDAFKPEDLFPIVDETVTVKEVGEKVGVPAGHFDGAIRVVETSQLPDSSPETKWYAPGVGVVKGKTKGESFALIASTFNARGRSSTPTGRSRRVTETSIGGA